MSVYINVQLCILFLLSYSSYSWPLFNCSPLLKREVLKAGGGFNWHRIVTNGRTLVLIVLNLRVLLPETYFVCILSFSQNVSHFWRGDMFGDDSASLTIICEKDLHRTHFKRPIYRALSFTLSLHASWCSVSTFTKHKILIFDYEDCGRGDHEEIFLRCASRHMSHDIPLNRLLLIGHISLANTNIIYIFQKP
jgi:hypothetical protein